MVNFQSFKALCHGCPTVSKIPGARGLRRPADTTQRRGGRKLIMTPEGSAALARKPNRDETLVKALARAHRWRRRIESGQHRPGY